MQILKELIADTQAFVRLSDHTDGKQTLGISTAKTF